MPEQIVRDYHSTAEFQREATKNATHWHVVSRDESTAGGLGHLTPHRKHIRVVYEAGPSEEVALVRLVDITRVYGDGDTAVRALDGVSLDIAPGEYIAIMGPSGSGKSTLMNILGCLDRPTSGRYLLAGRDVAGMDDEELASLRSRQVGFVFQHFNLLPRMSALEQVELPLVYHAEGHRRAAARAALAAMGLSDRIQHKPTELSGGQQQRVAIARALVTNPSIILADEPTGALDTQTSHEIMELLTSLVRDKRITVVLVTHEQDVANYADRVIRMRDGKVIEDTRKAGDASGA